MDENRNHTSTSILIGCGLISILLYVVRFTIFSGSNIDSKESFGFLFFGVGYLLLGLSRKNTGGTDRQELFSNLANAALIIGTVFIGYYTYSSLK